MPKNDKRGDNAKKSNISVTPNIEEMNNNVVFGDVNPKIKAKRGSTADASAKKSGDVVPASSSSDPSKKSDVKKLVSTLTFRGHPIAAKLGPYSLLRDVYSPQIFYWLDVSNQKLKLTIHS